MTSKQMLVRSLQKSPRFTVMVNKGPQWWQRGHQDRAAELEVNKLHKLCRSAQSAPLFPQWSPEHFWGGTNTPLSAPREICATQTVPITGNGHFANTNKPKWLPQRWEKPMDGTGNRSATQRARGPSQLPATWAELCPSTWGIYLFLRQLSPWCQGMGLSQFQAHFSRFMVMWLTARHSEIWCRKKNYQGCILELMGEERIDLQRSKGWSLLKGLLVLSPQKEQFSENKPFFGRARWFP